MWLRGKGESRPGESAAAPRPGRAPTREVSVFTERSAASSAWPFGSVYSYYADTTEAEDEEDPGDEGDEPPTADAATQTVERRPPPPPRRGFPVRLPVRRAQPDDWDDSEHPGCCGLTFGYRTLLEAAAAAGTSASELEVERLLSRGPRAWEDSWVGLYGVSWATVSPAAQAAAAGSSTALASILESGADPRRGARVCGGLAMASTPAWFALHTENRASHSAQESAARLLDAGAHPDEGLTWGLLGSVAAATPLSAACASGDEETVQLLLAAGADPAAGVTYGPFGLCGHLSALECALESGGVAQGTAVPLPRPGHRVQPSAPSAGAQPPSVGGVVRALLDAGCDPNTGGGRRHTPLYAAAVRGDVDAVEALLEAGADPDAGAPWLWGLLGHTTPLGAASAAGDTDTAAALLEGGAGIEEGVSCSCLGAPLVAESPLIEAARHGHTEVVGTLLEAGADRGRPYRGLYGHWLLPPLPPRTWDGDGKVTTGAPRRGRSRGGAPDDSEASEAEVPEDSPGLRRIKSVAWRKGPQDHIT